MASVMGINKIGLPKLSENMDPEVTQFHLQRT